jgi:hypothetical protein
MNQLDTPQLHLKILLLEEKIEKLKSSKEWYAFRCELLQKVQKYMRDPERTIVCDILANNSLLPDPSGERYGQDLWKLIYGTPE